MGNSFSMNTRGGMRAVACEICNVWPTRTRSRAAQGLSHSVTAPQTTAANRQNSPIGRTALRPGTPAARIAVISPSVDMRPSASSVPTSTPIGIV